LDVDNEPQPDVCLFVAPTGGPPRVDGDDYIAVAPEFVAEVAASSVSYDLGPKMNAYRRNGVREYLVWRVQDQVIDWFVLRDGRYEPLGRDDAGIAKSQCMPGLWLDTAAMVRLDMPAVVRVLQQGLASGEHQTFVAT